MKIWDSNERFRMLARRMWDIRVRRWQRVVSSGRRFRRWHCKKIAPIDKSPTRRCRCWTSSSSHRTATPRDYCFQTVPKTRPSMSLQMLTRGDPEQMPLHWGDHPENGYRGSHHLHDLGLQLPQPAPLEDTC